MKRCTSCGRVHSPADWAALPLVGVQRFEDPEEPPLELRNCPCRSTLAIELMSDPPDSRVDQS